MATVEVDEDRFAAMLAELKPHLDERQWRLTLGAQARALGRGGISRVAALTKSHPDTVSRGARELEQGIEPGGRVRQVGAGRPSATGLDPGLVDALRKLVEPETRGDPMQPLVWTTKSTGNLAGELGRAGRPVSADTVGRLLKDRLGYSLQGNAKTIEGKQHPDRDAQFRYINDLVTWCLAAGIPVISIDCKKKELVGNFRNGGAEWEPKGSPRQVNDHDFADKQLGKVAPYGIYDVAANSGWVNVGTDHETAAFAVESIRRWWKAAGARTYPGARQLLITADCGGSNGNRRRLWKVELARLATELGIEITVVHLPPGASKWNKIEHRLFSAISMNWRGRPLESHQVILETIRATTTRTGLKVQAELDTGSYPTGIEVTRKQMKDLEAQVIIPHEFHADWNYTIVPGYLGLDHDTPRYHLVNFAERPNEPQAPLGQTHMRPIRAVARSPGAPAPRPPARAAPAHGALVLSPAAHRIGVTGHVRRAVRDGEHDPITGDPHGRDRLPPLAAVAVLPEVHLPPDPLQEFPAIAVPVRTDGHSALPPYSAGPANCGPTRIHQGKV